MDRLQNRANRDLMRFHRNDCRILHLERNNTRHQYRLEVNLPESSSMDKDLGVLVVSKLSVGQQSAFVAKNASGLLECIN